MGAVISAFVIFALRFVGVISSHWDWCFFLVGIVVYTRYNIASFKHTYRNNMNMWLKKLGDNFSDGEKIYLTEASGIIMPPIMLWSHFFRTEAGSACFWCNILSVLSLIISLICGDYGSASVALIVFLSNYGQWPWQPGIFYTGFKDIDMTNAISLYYRKAFGKMIYDEEKEKLKSMIFTFSHFTQDRFYYLVNEEMEKSRT